MDDGEASTVEEVVQVKDLAIGKPGQSFTERVEVTVLDSQVKIILRLKEVMPDLLLLHLELLVLLGHSRVQVLRHLVLVGLVLLTQRRVGRNLVEVVAMTLVLSHIPLL